MRRFLVVCLESFLLGHLVKGTGNFKQGFALVRCDRRDCGGTPMQAHIRLSAGVYPAVRGAHYDVAAFTPRLPEGLDLIARVFHLVRPLWALCQLCISADFGA